MKSTKRLASLILALCLVCLLFPTGALAWEEVFAGNGEEKTETFESIDTQGPGIMVNVVGNGKATAIVNGDIHATEEGASIDPGFSGEASLQARDVTVVGWYGVDMNVILGTASAEVGDVTVQGAVRVGNDVPQTTIGINVDNMAGNATVAAGNVTLYEDDDFPIGAEYEPAPVGVCADTVGNGQTEVTVKNVASEVNGVQATATYGGTTTVNTGDIQAQEMAVLIDAETAGTVNVKTGDLSALEEDGYLMTGVLAIATKEKLEQDGGLVGSDAAQPDGDTAVTIDVGNVDAVMGMYLTSAGEGTSIQATSKNVTGGEAAVVGLSYGGDIEVTVAGDATAMGVGLVVGAASENGTVDVVVDGTISGGADGLPDIAVAYGSDLNNISITVWAVDAEEDVPMVQTIDVVDEEYRFDTDRQSQTLEQQINYIIRVAQTDGATLSVTDENGGALVKVRDQYEVAREGDKVLLNVNEDYNHRLVGVYNGLDGSRMALVQDADGHYYVLVPRGGGVYLSVDLEQIRQLPKKAAAVKGSDWLLSLVFYEDGTYVAFLKDGRKDFGHVELKEGKLELVSGSGVEMPIDDEGFVTYVYGALSVKVQIEAEDLALIRNIMAALMALFVG